MKFVRKKILRLLMIIHYARVFTKARDSREPLLTSLLTIPTPQCQQPGGLVPPSHITRFHVGPPHISSIENYSKVCV